MPDKKRAIKINYCDSSGDKYDKYAMSIIEKYLSEDYDLVFCDEPDFLFCFPYTTNFMRYKNCVKIFFYGENVVPNFNYYDYAIGFHDMKFNGRHLCLPYFNEFIPELADIGKKDLPEGTVARRFCNFVYSNSGMGSGTVLRREFAEKLMKYKRVDCPGKVLRNMDGGVNGRASDDWSGGMISFTGNYKFTIAFENSSQLGYITEKICQPFLGRSIPIYWGAPDVTSYFNPRAFINCGDYETMDDAMKKVIELDNDDDAYMNMLREQPLKDKAILRVEDTAVANFLRAIIEHGNKPFYRDELHWDVMSQHLDRRIIKVNLLCTWFYYLCISVLSVIFPKKCGSRKEIYRKRLECALNLRKNYRGIFAVALSRLASVVKAKFRRM
ncbi:hypothetical protein FACS1894216_12790 [Synergistales bacterium]|nr:hypothetical protein FACS1894216_12790 [Synergistales bacterium]